jgi:hypothetical protein
MSLDCMRERIAIGRRSRMLDGRGRWRNFNQAGHAAQKKATRSDGLEVGLPSSEPEA